MAEIVELHGITLGIESLAGSANIPSSLQSKLAVNRPQKGLFLPSQSNVLGDKEPDTSTSEYVIRDCWIITTTLCTIPPWQSGTDGGGAAGGEKGWESGRRGGGGGGVRLSGSILQD